MSVDITMDYHDDHDHNLDKHGGEGAAAVVIVDGADVAPVMPARRRTVVHSYRFLCNTFQIENVSPVQI